MSIIEALKTETATPLQRELQIEQRIIGGAAATRNEAEAQQIAWEATPFFGGLFDDEEA
jgi:hypothetical protein